MSSSTLELPDIETNFSDEDVRKMILPHPAGPSSVSGRWLKCYDSWTLSGINPTGPTWRYGLIPVPRSTSSYIESTSISSHNLNAYRVSRSHEGVHVADYNTTGSQGTRSRMLHVAAKMQK